MKNYKLITLLFFFIVFSMKAQTLENLKITYEHTFQFNKNKPDTEKELFVLLIDIPHKKSTYYSLNKYVSDSVYAAINSGKIKIIDYDIPESKFNFEVKKDYLTNKLTYTEEINGKTYGIDSHPNESWKIANEEKIILEYPCKRADIKLGNRNWTAYYIPDIPIPEGPYKFFGLPGLILEIHSEDSEHIIKTVSIEKTAQKPKTSNFVNLKRYKKLIEIKRKYVEDPSANERIEDAKHNNKEMIVNGVKMNLTETYKLINQEVWDFTDKYNNPIEKDDIWIR